jgi:hypothetical protein
MPHLNVQSLSGVSATSVQHSVGAEGVSNGESVCKCQCCNQDITRQDSQRSQYVHTYKQAQDLASGHLGSVIDKQVWLETKTVIAPLKFTDQEHLIGSGAYPKLECCLLEGCTHRSSHKGYQHTVRYLSF